MELKEAKGKYIFTTRIELEDGDFIVLREPTTLEMKEISRDEDKNMDVLYKMFDSCLVEHSFTEEGKPAATKDVASLLKQSSSRFFEILTVWMESLPLAKRNNKN